MENRMRRPTNARHSRSDSLTDLVPKLFPLRQSERVAEKSQDLGLSVGLTKYTPQ